MYRILRAVRHGSKSEYADIVVINGKEVRIRLANHNVKVSNYDNAGKSNGISIVISRYSNEGIYNDGSAHLVEFFYSDKKINSADGKPLVEILKSIKQSLYSGQYIDTTGLAEREEVNKPTSFRSIRPDESLTDYARAVVKQYNTTTASPDNNRNIGKETLGITNKHTNFTEIATEIINNIASTYNLSHACGITAVVNNADDVEYMRRFLGEEEYNIIKKRFNEPFVSGVSIPERNLSVVFPAKTLNIDEVVTTWFHETTHILFKKLTLKEKNEYGLTALAIAKNEL